MRTLSIFLLLAATVLLTSADTTITNTYTLSGNYTVTIHGTSNLHDWNEKVVKVSGNSIVSWNNDGSYDLGSMNIHMDVRSIKSTEGSVMNNNTYKALKADNNPEITFVLLTPVKAIPPGTHVINAKINLSIAGVTKAIDMPVTSVSQARGEISFEGSKVIKMTDYGIKPPIALFGTLKTGGDITINFKTVFVVAK